MRPEFDDLRHRRYISLTTFRRSGEPVATPVWHAMHDGRTFVQTGRDSGKAKRLRRNPAVTLAACTARGHVKGPAVAAQARILDGAEAREAAALLLRRYGWQKRIALHLAKRRGEETILLEITPEEGAAMPASVERNKATVRRVFAEVVNQGKLDLIPELYQPDVVDHDPLPGAPEGLDGVRYSIGGLRAAMPDLEVTIQDMSAHGDKVVVHNTWRGTQRGRLLGLPGSGRATVSEGIVIWRLVDGRIAERWAMTELAGRLRAGVA